MIDYPAARAIAMIVQTGSFEAAARALGVTPSAISQRVRNFEERLGTVLVERGSPCRPTETGAMLCLHMEQVGVLENTLMQRMPGLGEGGAFRTSLSIATNADSLATWLTEALTEFGADGDCLLNISVDDEEHTADALRNGRVIGAISALDRPVQGCAIKPLGSLRYAATASPAFVQKYLAEGVTPRSLARAPALCFDRKDQLQQSWVRNTFGQQLAFPTHWLPSTHAFVEACLGGLGWALNPQSMVSAHLASGRLVELVPGAVFDRPLYWQINRIVMPQLAALTRAIKRAARKGLVPAAQGDAAEPHDGM